MDEFMKPAQNSKNSKSHNQRAKTIFRGAVEKPDLTPLTRLAKFKAIRDRNLKHPHVIHKRLSVNKQIMEGKVNGISDSESKKKKEKSLTVLNGKNEEKTKKSTSEESTSTNEGFVENVTDLKNESSTESVELELQLQEEIVSTDDPKEGSSSSQMIDPESLEGGDSRGEEDSQGSSLDVVGDFASIEELDPKLCLDSSDEEIVTENFEEFEPVVEETKPVEVFVPDIVKKMAAGKMQIRPTLRGEYESPQLKRKLGGVAVCSKKMRSSEDGSTSSPGWKYFTQTLPFNKLWTSTEDVDDNRENGVADKQGDDTQTLIKDMQEDKSSLSRWCNLM